MFLFFTEVSKANLFNLILIVSRINDKCKTFFEDFLILFGSRSNRGRLLTFLAFCAIIKSYRANILSKRRDRGMSGTLLLFAIFAGILVLPYLLLVLKAILAVLYSIFEGIFNSGNFMDI